MSLVQRSAVFGGHVFSGNGAQKLLLIIDQGNVTVLTEVLHMPHTVVYRILGWDLKSSR